MRFNRRDANEQSIVDALERAGCLVDRVERKAYDVVVGRANRNYLLEIKTEKGTVRDSQFAFQRAWCGQYSVVRNVEEALKAVGLGEGI